MRLKGDRKKQLFIEEAGQSMFMYITPLLKNKYPELMIPWLAQFDSGVCTGLATIFLAHLRSISLQCFRFM